MAAKASMWLLGKGGLVCESRSERAIGDKNRSKIPYMLIYIHISRYAILLAQLLHLRYILMLFSLQWLNAGTLTQGSKTGVGLPCIRLTVMTNPSQSCSGVLFHGLHAPKL